MGLPPFRSSSFCGCDQQERVPDLGSVQTPEAPSNPNPSNFEVTQLDKIGPFLLAVVQYPNCTNYEGRKVLVYRDVTAKQLCSQQRLDPHFCDNSDHLSPVGRFEPTEEGLEMARQFCVFLATEY